MKAGEKGGLQGQCLKENLRAFPALIAECCKRQFGRRQFLFQSLNVPARRRQKICAKVAEKFRRRKKHSQRIIFH